MGTCIEPHNITFPTTPGTNIDPEVERDCTGRENNIEHTRICNREGVIDYKQMKVLDSGTVRYQA